MILETREGTHRPFVYDRCGISVLPEASAGGGATLRVDDVSPGSPAEEGGLRKGDRLLNVNEYPSSDLSLDRLGHILRGPVGANVVFKVRRGTREVELTVTLQKRV